MYILEMNPLLVTSFANVFFSCSVGCLFVLFTISFAEQGASLRAQLVKNPPAMQETPVLFLGWEDPLEKERIPTPVFWPGEFRGLV